MKKFLSVLLCLALLCCSVIFVSAENAEYLLLGDSYVRLLGRGEVVGDSRCFNWPNSGFEFEFSGSKAEVYADDVRENASEAYNGSFFNVAVYDGDTLIRVNRMKLVSGWNTIYEEQSGDPSLKKIMMVRSSEPCRGTIKMSKIRTDAVPNTSAPREKLIEFIGDSFTAGYGNSKHLSPVNIYCAENTDNWNSYTGFVARHYNADNNVIAYQGKGVYANRSLSKLNHTMSHQFGYEEIKVDADIYNMSSLEKHKFYKYQPQLVTIWLGTNDAAAPVDQDTFKTAYAALLDNVRTQYPNATILNMALTNSMYLDTIKSVVNDATRGEKNKCYMLELDMFESTNLGHPDVAEGQRIANQIIEKLDSIKDLWNVPLVGSDDAPLLSMRANYNTGEVVVYGKTSSAKDHVSLMVTKPDASIENIKEDKSIVAFLGQANTIEGKEYSFEFNVEKLSGEYTLYLNSYVLDDLQEKQFVFKNLIPVVDVTSGGKTVKNMSDISSGKDIKVTLSGFDVPEEEFSGMLALAQYSNGVLETVEIADASKDSQAYGDEVVLGSTVKDTADCIRVFYMNKNTLTPLFGSYVIE